MSPELGLTGTWWDIALTFSGPIVGSMALVVFMALAWIDGQARELWDGEE